MTDKGATARERWGLSEVARVSVDGQCWVVYSDGVFRWAVTLADWDGPAPEADYSLWCVATTAAGDPGLVARIAAAAGLVDAEASDR